ncbi:MAG: c-type cytochrome [Gammaproteobacteria bacterium]
MKFFNTLFIITLLSISLNAKELGVPGILPVGDAVSGKALVSQCAACHGASGASSNSDWPNLAGQGEKYLFSQLKYFQTTERQNPLMMAVVPYLKTLSDDQLLDIAAYYSSLPLSLGQAKNDQTLLDRGEWLYRAGDLDKSIPACTACHGLAGKGLNQAGFPAISGQQVNYLQDTLKAYRSNTRAAGDYASVMQAVAVNLTDADIEALANYMHGLYLQ